MELLRVSLLTCCVWTLYLIFNAQIRLTRDILQASHPTDVFRIVTHLRCLDGLLSRTYARDIT